MTRLSGNPFATTLPAMVAAMLVAASPAAATQATETKTAATQADKPMYAEGRMLVLVAPTYPKEALAKGLTATVNVSGTVRTDGLLEGVRIESTPPGEAFESAVMDVVPLWRLQPRIVTPGCGAEDTRGRVTIWFEIADGKQKVSYGTHPAGSGAPAEIITDRAPVRAVKPLYPRKLAQDPRAPKAILQLAYVAVSGDGDVTGVTVAPMLHYREFEPLLAAALRQWKYAPQERSWCAEVRFHMTLE